MAFKDDLLCAEPDAAPYLCCKQPLAAGARKVELHVSLEGLCKLKERLHLLKKHDEVSRPLIHFYIKNGRENIFGTRKSVITPLVCIPNLLDML